MESCLSVQRGTVRQSVRASLNISTAFVAPLVLNLVANPRASRFCGRNLPRGDRDTFCDKSRCEEAKVHGMDPAPGSEQYK